LRRRLDDIVDVTALVCRSDISTSTVLFQMLAPRVPVSMAALARELPPGIAAPAWLVILAGRVKSVGGATVELKCSHVKPCAFALVIPNVYPFIGYGKRVAAKMYTV